MKKILNSLPFKLLLGVAVGIVLGLVANEAVMNVVVTIKQVLGQIITFCVPLIVIGFIAPSITKLGHNASRMLGIALIIAYVSSVGAALMSTQQVLRQRHPAARTGAVADGRSGHHLDQIQDDGVPA